MTDSNNKKKQVPLRLSAELYDALMEWADDEFRSVNGQIEYLLTECVRKHRKRDLSKSEDKKDVSFDLKGDK